MIDSVRARLTLWYVLILGILLVLFSLLLYWLIARHEANHFDYVLANYVHTAGDGFRGQLAENFGDANVAMAHTLVEFRPHDLFLAIYRTAPTGTELLGASHLGREKSPSGETIVPVTPAAALFAAARSSADPVMTTIDDGGSEGGIRAALWRIEERGHEFYILMAQSRAEVVGNLRAIRRYLYLCLPLMLIVAGLAGLLLADRSLAPIAAISAQAEHLTAENLHQRLPVSNPRDELGRLATIFNELLGRLNRTFDGMREFMADASHELRTPLAIIRGESEVALSQDRPASEYRESLLIIHDEARYLSRIVDDLMALARFDAGQQSLRREEIYFNDLVEECVRQAQVLARAREMTLVFERREDLPFSGDEGLLRRMILNLLDNAIKYTPAGGTIDVRLERVDGQIRLIVTDTGIGIPVEAVAFIFERFYRLEKSRTRTEGGSGLGLPIVKWVAEAHRGRVEVESTLGEGSAFTVILPCEDAAVSGS
jgi:heavy metal sensor kinase